MPRRMSCSLTVDAVRERRKTVTRRHVDTWRNLKPGDRLTLIEKGMGLPKGSRQVVLAEVEVVDVDIEPLWKLTDDEVYGHEECEREGFPTMEPAEFCSFWMESHGYRPRSQNEAMAVQCRRICWRYLVEEDSDECPDCGFVLADDMSGTLERTPRAASQPCEPCLWAHGPFEFERTTADEVA